MELIGYILGIIFFILLEGLFSGSEMAILSSNKSRLEAFVKKSNNSYKDMVSKFFEKPRRVSNVYTIWIHHKHSVCSKPLHHNAF